MNADHDRDLIHLLADSTALTAPVRDRSDWRAVSDVYTARRELISQGLPYHSGGGSSAERVAAFRHADSLERAGRVQFRRSGGKRTHWWLSTAEFWRLRFLCRLPSEADLRAGMLAIQRMAAADHPRENGCVRERFLAGDCFTAGGLRTIFEILSPGLLFGWVDSSTDTSGQARYSLTASGREWIDSPPGEFTPPKASEATRDEYEAVYREAEREALWGIQILPDGFFDPPAPHPCGPAFDFPPPAPPAGVRPLLTASGEIVRDA